MKIASPSTWISVTDRLPEVGQVFVSYERLAWGEGYQFLSREEDRSGRPTYKTMELGNDPFSFTHWLPLPEAPEDPLSAILREECDRRDTDIPK